MARVLICDDAVAYGGLFTLWMRAEGIDDVAHARTAGETLTLAGRIQPDVVVLDHLLPDGSSEELVPRLREVTPDSRILLISGMPEDRLADAAAAVEADGHISKASTAQAMRAAVVALLG